MTTHCDVYFHLDLPLITEFTLYTLTCASTVLADVLNHIAGIVGKHYNAVPVCDGILGVGARVYR